MSIWWLHPDTIGCLTGFFICRPNIVSLSVLRSIFIFVFITCAYHYYFCRDVVVLKYRHFSISHSLYLTGLLIILFLFIPQLLYDVFVKDLFGFVGWLQVGSADPESSSQYASNWDGGREILTGKVFDRLLIAFFKSVCPRNYLERLFRGTYKCVYVL